MNSRFMKYEFINKKLSKLLVTPFIFVGLRSWETYPSSQSFGPTASHKDGFEPGHKKVMVYLNFK